MTLLRKAREAPCLISKIGEVVPELETNALALKNAGEFSKPFRSPYGFHIVKLMKRKGVPPMAEIQTSLRSEVQKDGRSKLSKQALVKQILKENSFKENIANAQEAIKLADARLPQGSWSYDVEKSYTQ